MSDPVPHDAKYAWFELPAAAPPKRSATDRLADFLEVYGPYDEATAREQASRCLQCPEPLCVQGCPLGSRIPEWLLLTAEGHFLEAAALTRSANNLAEICAQVCPEDELCEGACLLNGKAEAVSISAIERFLNEYAFTHGAVDNPPAKPNGLAVAVLGSGPGGLACADELASRGYAVTVFETQPLLGGLLVNGIPALKLERSAVERRIELLRRRGVRFQIGTEAGREINLRAVRDRFDAVFLGFDAQRAHRLEVPGADLKGVSQALPFIIHHVTDVPLDVPPPEVKGRRVVVLGGGDTALDCARTALRGGAVEVRCLYRRDRANLPANPRAYENALAEGVKFDFLTVAVEVLGDRDGTVTGIRCVRTRLETPDASGRPRPVPVAGSEFTLPADVVLIAYGFDPLPHRAWTDYLELAQTEVGRLRVDENQMTSLPGVFAGGTIVRGPSPVVYAVRDGRRAAQAIHHYLASKREGDLGTSHTDHLTPEPL